jgi:hypothetical protein
MVLFRRSTRDASFARTAGPGIMKTVAAGVLKWLLLRAGWPRKTRGAKKL